ncbi:MAG: TrmH family RNA methyltransferase [Planctomycetota bacterium]
MLPQLHSKGITSLAATPSETATPIDSLPNRRVSTLLLMGNESEGLAESVLQAAAVQVRIAMTVRQSATVVDSLNVSVAGAILMHELRKRQDVCT